MMKKRKKQIMRLVVIFTLVLSIPVKAMAAEVLVVETTEQQSVEVERNVLEEDVMEPVVYDYAGLLTETEILDLEMQITSLKEISEWEVFAVTTSDAQGKSATVYADEFFDERTPVEADGIVVLIDMDNREICISSAGMAERYLEDIRSSRSSLLEVLCLLQMHYRRFCRIRNPRRSI